MNIGIVTTWFERGAAYVSRQYKEVLEDTGSTVFVYARGGEVNAVDKSRWGGERVTEAKIVPFPLPTYIDEVDFKQWLINNNIEIVFFNEQRWLKPVVMCKDLGIKTGLYVDYYTEDSLASFDVFDFLICNTRKHYSAFEWHEQVYYIPWGTDVELFDASSKRLQSEKVRFFTSSGMNPYRKGTDLVINAFADAVQSPAVANNAELVVHTQIPLIDFFLNRGGYEGTIKNIRLLDGLGVLRVIEKTVGAPGLYYEGDVYVYPSRLDGIGLTVAEAISSGMPVIVPDDGPMNEFLPECGSAAVRIKRLFCRSDAYYWPQNEVDVKYLAELLVNYVASKESIPSYSNSSREYAVKNLNWKSRKNQISDAFFNSKIRVLTSNTRNNALRAFTSGYPRIDRYELIYKYLYRFFFGKS